MPLEHSHQKKKPIEIADECRKLFYTGKREDIERGITLATESNVSLDYILYHLRYQLDDYSIDTLVTYFSVDMSFPSILIPIIKIPKQDVLHLLQWPNYLYYNYPPHKYPWSMRDEKSLLLYISTVFDNATEFKQWLSQYPIDLHNSNLDKYVNWICKPSTTIHKKINPILTTLKNSHPQIIQLYTLK